MYNKSISTKQQNKTRKRIRNAVKYDVQLFKTNDDSYNNAEDRKLYYSRINDIEQINDEMLDFIDDLELRLSTANYNTKDEDKKQIYKIFYEAEKEINRMKIPSKEKRLLHDTFRKPKDKVVDYLNSMTENKENKDTDIEMKMSNLKLSEPESTEFTIKKIKQLSEPSFEYRTEFKDDDDYLNYRKLEYTYENESIDKNEKGKYESPFNKPNKPTKSNEFIRPPKQKTGLTLRRESENQVTPQNASFGENKFMDSAPQVINMQSDIKDNNVPEGIQFKTGRNMRRDQLNKYIPQSAPIKFEGQIPQEFKITNVFQRPELKKTGRNIRRDQLNDYQPQSAPIKFQGQTPQDFKITNVFQRPALKKTGRNMRRDQLNSNIGKGYGDFTEPTSSSISNPMIPVTERKSDKDREVKINDMEYKQDEEKEQLDYITEIQRESNILKGQGKGQVDMFNGNDPAIEDNRESDNVNVIGASMSGWDRYMLNKRQNQARMSHIIGIGGQQVIEGDNNFPTHVQEENSNFNRARSQVEYTGNDFIPTSAIAPSVSIANSIKEEHDRFLGIEDDDELGLKIDEGLRQNFNLQNEAGIGFFKTDNKDIDATGDGYSLEDRFKNAGNTRRDKNYKIRKWDPMRGYNNRIKHQFSQASLKELRSNDIEWKRPSRTVSNNYVNLMRIGNSTTGKIDNEYMP